MIGRGRIERGLDFQDFIVPFLRTAVVLICIFISSVYIAQSIYYRTVPVFYSHKLYFNYDAELPIAVVNILSLEDQWLAHHKHTTWVKNFIISGLEYKIKIKFLIASSQQNLEFARFMCILLLKDIFGSELAKSTRPVVFPYQSPLTLTLQTLIEFPLRMIGVLDIAEYKTITVEMMNNFFMTASAPVETIQVLLGSRAATVLDAHISFFPVVAGFRYSSAILDIC